MQTLSAKDTKYNFWRLIGTALAEPVTVKTHGGAVVVALAVEEYERLKGIAVTRRAKAPRSVKKEMRRRGTANRPQDDRLVVVLTTVGSVDGNEWGEQK